MKSLSRLLVQHHDVLPYRRADGTAPIVVALPDDAVGDVNGWVQEVGGCANVILAERNGFSVSTWDVDALPTDDTIDLHHDSSMAMLRAWADLSPSGSASFNVLTSVAQAKEIAYQF
ncbi:hypothetical protein J2Y69_002309 [Microbacterium resistens]|uniref:Uncharacterized protein n=1 Tax=Microbacterium resistens TaxID=156977 RepID=A0ABU1SDM8_9MICO|nr:hypothetical protein [Microbacterium resistens]MDR6867705.1 hypothetical protein [Microbacterium resistens]